MSEPNGVGVLVVGLSCLVVAGCGPGYPAETICVEDAALSIDSVTKQARLTANVTPDSQFGSSVALSGETLLAGAFRDSSGPDLGTLFFFGRAGGTWSSPVQLNVPGQCGGLGESVALDGDTALAMDGCAGGAVHVLERRGETWAYAQTLVPSDAGEPTAFGLALAIQGDTAAIGDAARGSAYVFSRTPAGWQEDAKLSASDPTLSFGESVAIDAGTVLVGALEPDNWTGAAYVFTASAAGWIQRAKLIAPSHDYPYFGRAVSLRGDTALVSSGGPSTLDSGAVHVFVGGGGSFAQEATLVPSDGRIGAGFGTSVAFENDLAVIGSPLDPDGPQGLEEASSAYLFSRASGAWTEAFKLTASETARGDQFGAPVSLSGNTVAIGAQRGNLGQGAAYAFTFVASQGDADGDGVVKPVDRCPLAPARNIPRSKHSRRRAPR